MFLESPKLFNEFIINSSVINKLRNYTQDNLMNMLFYGPAGSGKRTLVLALLYHIYKLTDLQTYIKNYTVKINNNDVKIVCIQSMYHYEINLYEYGLYDREVLTSFVKNIISTKNILNNGFKIIVLNNFHKISKTCQLALRALIEKHISTARFILLTNSVTKIDSALKSRFICNRVPFPDDNSIIKYLNKVGVHENIPYILKTIDKNLYNLEICINYKKYINPIDIFIKKIDDIINSSDILFIEELRKIIHKLHLLNFDPYVTINKYISYCVKLKKYSDKNLGRICSKAAELDSSEPYNKYFFSLELFFIFIKSLNYI
uniref:ATPase AAA-type core domain-containing protein n=1 Tax=viral metagenome TaxID=1070528 RepID=A0A6C0EHL3_9ZZZZ